MLNLGTHSGKEAFNELLGWKSGKFELETDPAAPIQTITILWPDQLLNGLQKLDESRPTDEMSFGYN